MSRPAAALALIRMAKDEGLRVTCDTAPPYFDLNETAIGDWRTFAKLSPPLRADADRRAVAAALLDGTIDAVASDHQPRDADDKRLPFAQAASGGAGLATLSGRHAGAGAWRVAAADPRDRAFDDRAGAAARDLRRARWRRARRPICVCSSRSGSGRWSPATCPAGAEHPVRRARAGGQGAGDVEGGAAGVWGMSSNAHGYFAAAAFGSISTATNRTSRRTFMSIARGVGETVA